MGGQAFRWQRREEGWYSGVILDRLIHLRSSRNGLEYRANGPGGEVRQLLESYFRTDDDHALILTRLRRERKIGPLVSKYPGLRLLRQDPWECLVAYLCSPNNNIQQISRICEALAEAFGSELSLDEDKRNTFPSPGNVLRAGLENLRTLRLGLKRAESIHAAATEVENGTLDLQALRAATYPEALDRLLKCKGVGHKVANCVLLFSLDKPEAFPIDRHIARALWDEYFPGLPEPRDSELPHAASLFQDHFGNIAGYAGQFLFHDRLQSARS